MTWNDLLPRATIQLGKSLETRAAKEREAGKSLFPSQDQIFRALDLTGPDQIRTCIVGQDPYHTPGAANGLAFSVNNGQPIQPSLKHIFEEYSRDLDLPEPTNGDLTPWAEQGVLLLNTTLTVYEGEPNSCLNWGWRDFTKVVVNSLARLEQPIVFILWGANAQDLLTAITQKAATFSEDGRIQRQRLIKKAAILSSHPSPFSYAKKCRKTPPFKGSRPFSTANELLVEMGGEPVDWRL